MNSTFSLFDIPVVLIIAWAGIAPNHFCKTARFPSGLAAVWMPRMRWIAPVAFILLIISRFVFGYMVKNSGVPMPVIIQN